MKIILSQSVPPLGIKGNVVEVADGYARNYLIPKGLAIPATSGNLKHLEQERKILAKKEAQQKEKALKLASELEGKTLTLKVKTGEEGKLYGSVTAKDVAEAIEKQLGKEIEKKKIIFPQNIKEVGTFPTVIKIYPEVEAQISLKVQGDKSESKQ